MARETPRVRAPAPPLRQITIERELFLRGLSGAGTQGHAAPQLARSMSDAAFRAGETIYRAGDFSRVIHFITRGDVELALPGAEPRRLSAPAVIGVLDVNQRRPYARTATAITEVRALTLHEDDWMEALEDNTEFARGSILRLAADVHRMHLLAAPDGAFPAPPPPAADTDAHALNLQERTLALRAVPCFKSAVVQALALLASGAEERALERGERLFTRGERTDGIVVVARGTIGVEREEPTIRARFGPGAIVGGAGAMSFVTQEYTAEAETPAVLLAIRRDDLVDSLEDHREMIHAMFDGLALEREHLLDASPPHTTRNRLAPG